MNEKDFRKKYEKSLNTQGRKKLWNYFLDLIKTEKFQKEVDEIRKLGNEKVKTYRTYKNITQNIKSLALEYGLDTEDWEEPLEEYIFHNKLEIPEGVDMCKIITLSDLEEYFIDEEKEDLYEISLLPEEYREKILNSRKEISKYKHPLEDYHKKMNLLSNYPIVILVNPKASLRDMQDFIAKNYDLNITNLQKAFKDSLFSKNNIGKSRKKNNFIQKRNEFIYQNRHLPRRKIMSLVTDKFGSKNTIDYGYIGKIISLEKKKRKEL